MMGTQIPDGNLRESRGAAVSGQPLEIRLHEALTVRVAPELCRVVRDGLRGRRELWINLEEVKDMDAVGLAALRDSARFAESSGVSTWILPSPEVYRALLLAGIIDDLALAGRGSGPSGPTTVVELDTFAAETLGAAVAATGRLCVRPPAWDDLALFERWANESRLDEMVGSQLLYLCRHLGPYHPEFTARTLHDPTSVTVLVEPLPGRGPVGFVRLYNVHLGEGFAFLETAIATPRALRGGMGIEASRLVLAWAMDVLGLRRIEAKVYAYNLLSVNSLRRNGFAQEGVLRRARTWEGQQWDILVFAILDEEMRRQRARDAFPYLGFWARDAAP